MEKNDPIRLVTTELYLLIKICCFSILYWIWEENKNKQTKHWQDKIIKFNDKKFNSLGTYFLTKI